MLKQSIRESSYQAAIRRSLEARSYRLFQTSFTINPLERWPDDNYAPRHLAVERFEDSEVVGYSAQLRGFRAEDVQVALHRGAVLILATRMQANECVEYYTELPIPLGARRRGAWMEFDNGLLVIGFVKRARRLQGLLGMTRHS